MSAHEDCPFCNPDPDRVAFSATLVQGIRDAFPVSPGHMLIVPRRHAATFEDLTASEKAAVWSAVDFAIAEIRSNHAPDGFNVGFNMGPAAGQTVFHFHLHVIPRYAGDVEDPRGGVRHVIPAKGNYLAPPVPAGGGGSPPPSAGEGARRLVTGGEDPLLPHLVLHLDTADTCDIAVAFLLDSGARLIGEHLRDFLARGGTARILVGDYLGVTDPTGLHRLDDIAADPTLRGRLTLKVYESGSTGFHLKSYVFVAGAEGVAFVGSSNLSEPALTTSVEWNYRVVSSHDEAGFGEIRAGFEALFSAPQSKPVTPAWIDAYAARRPQATRQWTPMLVARSDDGGQPPLLPPGMDPTPPEPAGVAPEPALPIPEPHAIQRQALAALERTRGDGFTAGLVVLATGLGKTWLAAFDSNRPEFGRILFVAHREEILSQAIETFRRVRPGARIGRLAGAVREVNADILFASVQTLGRMNHLRQFSPDAFDYVVVDEFHHAAASTYRRVIDHFRPKFLLGLTATPDRTDGADLLGLCQENLVFQAGIHQGISGGHLCPFHYFGVPDEVDYSHIPWRNAAFDLDALEAAVATEARARNALEQFRKHGGSRCIGFCVSQRHADFMAAFFTREGVRSVAVHSGPGSAPRTTSLLALARGEIAVVFAVDMFNEGVDVPAVDTVLMLRPTESTIIWLQQLGRGLRVAPGKERLSVIDYIGNHRVFLMKLRGLAVVMDQDDRRPREILDAVRDDSLSLPPGFEVTYDLAAIDILEALLRPTRTEEALEEFYRDFAERHGLRPTAVEAFHAGLNPRSNGERSWFGFVARMGDLAPAEAAAFAAARDFLAAMERTETTRSYKLVLLLAMMDGDTIRTRIDLPELSRRVASIVGRIHRLADDFTVDLSDMDAVARLMVRNPIEAFTGARGTGGVRYFDLDGRSFGFAFEIADPAAFASLLREILDWRLAQYLSRGGRAEQMADLICRVAQNAGGNPILVLPAPGTGGSLPEGPRPVTANGTPMVATVAKGAIDVVRDEDGGPNRLSDILRGWFGPEAGAPGRADRVRLRRSADGLVMEPVSALAAQGLTLWQRYLREAIPPAFGLTFNTAIWNVGYVVREPNIFLLVTLAKDNMNADHRYADRFLGPDLFEWQSQNRTTRTSRDGERIRNHRALGLHVHLLVRPTKRVGPTVTPFVYCGEVEFVSWEGDNPITVRWRLKEPVPPSLRSTLKVPD